MELHHYFCKEKHAWVYCKSIKYFCNRWEKTGMIALNLRSKLKQNCRAGKKLPYEEKGHWLMHSHIRYLLNAKFEFSNLPLKNNPI